MQSHMSCLTSLVRLRLLLIYSTVFLNDVGLDSEGLLLDLQNAASVQLPVGGTVASVTRLARVAHQDVVVVHREIVLVVVAG